MHWDNEKTRPQSNKECDDKQEDLPFRDRNVPKEAPVGTIRLISEL
jgi:hypothetical protein